MHTTKHFRLIFITLFIFLLSPITQAEVLFEGYYKVTQFKKHIGFLILRHEIEDKTQNFKTTSFIKLAKAGFDLTETYQAVSDKELAPLSISYLAVGDKKTKTIDVKFKNQQMTGTVTEDGKKIKVSEKIPKGVFLSSALYYLMLRSPGGLKTDSTFDYAAITEEGPVVMNGTVKVEKKMVTEAAHQLLKINNRFAGSEYDNWVSTRGEVVRAATPSTSIESALVRDPKEALEGIKLSAGTLEKVFGNSPTGAQNILSQKGK